MDFVSKTIAQLTDLFRSMTPAARVTATLLLAAIVVSLVYLFQFRVEAANDYLLGGRPFTASEITAVQRALSEAGLKNWELEGNRIKIPGGEKHVFIAALAEYNALPADPYTHLTGVMNGSNPFTSRFELDVKMKAAKQQELALVISRFRNVEQASVLFDEVEKDGLRRQKIKTASVAVQTNGAGLEEGQVKAIRNLLSSSYAGLERGSISITDTTSGISHSEPGDAASGGDGLYASAKKQYEADWRKKIIDRLAMVPGINVGVNVEMHPEIQADTTTVKYDPKVVPIRASESTLDSTSSGPNMSGRPGAVPNGVGAVGNQPAEVATMPGPKSSQNSTTSETVSMAGHEQTLLRKSPLVPQRVTASIDVPLSYFVKVWRQANPTPAGQTAKDPDPGELKRIETQERDRIKEAVVNLLPLPPAGKEPYPLVSVTTYIDLPSAAIAGPTIADQATTWFASNWTTVGMFVLGMVGLMMLRSMIGSAAPSSPAPAAQREEEHQATGHAEKEEEPADDKPEPILVMKRKLSTKGPNMREELRQLVKDDPDAAANVLRGWIGDAA